jgi:hypothetical protein
VLIEFYSGSNIVFTCPPVRSINAHKSVGYSLLPGLDYTYFFQITDHFR